MKPVVAGLTVQDLMAVSAYAASIQPPSATASTPSQAR
jgi:cytochrome c553